MKASICVVSERMTTDLNLTFGPAATVGQLLVKLTTAAPDAWGPDLWVDGVRFDSSRCLVDLPITDGVLLTPSPPRTGRPAVGQLVAVSGWDTGRIVRLTTGTYPAGSVLSRRLEVAGDTLQVGESSPVTYGETILEPQTAWRYEKATPSVPRTSGLFNRPPRQLPPAPPSPPSPPQREVTAKVGHVLRWTMIVGPLIMGAGMVIIFKRPSLSIFMALGPLMAVLNWFESKRGLRKADRLADVAHRAAIASFIKRLGSWLATSQAMGTTLYPDLPTILRRPGLRHPQLWERRAHHADFGQVMAGYSPIRSHLATGRTTDPFLAEALVRQLPIATLPLVVDLGAGRVIGVVGPAEQCRALARSLVIQMAIHHGPADLVIRTCSTPSQGTQWAWTALLPHARTTAGDASIHVTRDAVECLLSRPERAVVVIDHMYEPSFSGLVRGYARASGTVLVLAEDSSQLPAAVDQLITVSSPDISVSNPATGSVVAGTGLYMVADVCADAARDLVSISDPEQTTTQDLIPDTVNLLDLLDSDEIDAATIIRRWRRTPDRIAAPIGMSASGVIEIDLVRDGPHGLLAGTTGAGKSELLRTLVASLAASVDPEHLNFVLIDYKGGSAFDACANLPHVVGVVTDLDNHLAARAMTCLDAELKFREQVLRESGSTDLDGYLRLPERSPLPRLYLVVDEFAAMAGELPEFMNALVDIAARGRSLGVHLMLATQRPAGVVKDPIRANTNFRIALRVQTVADSRDVLDDGLAASLPRGFPGRGYIRLGPTELTELQTALISGSSHEPEPFKLVLSPVGQADRASPTLPSAHGESDLDRLVMAIQTAARETNMRPVRTPWPPALPETLPLSSLAGQPGAFGLVDEPANQRQQPHTWDRASGHLALYGMPGTGPERAAESAVAAICATPGDLRVYVLAYGTHPYTSLTDIPGVTPTIEPDDLERQTRLIRLLGDEFQRRRRRLGQAGPAIIVVIDDVAAFLKSLEPFHLAPLLDVVFNIMTKGHTAGIHVVATAFSSTALRTKMASGFTQRLAFSFPDRSHYAGLGVQVRHLPTLGFGRAIDVNSERIIQVATDHSDTVFPARSIQSAIPVMPTIVEGLARPPQTKQRPWHIPLGVGERELSEIGIELDAGDHLLIAGPARSGKSTSLALIARQAHLANPQLSLVAITPRRSPLTEATPFRYVVEDPSVVPDLGQALMNADEPVLVLVDDAELVEGLDDLLKSRHPHVTVAAAIRSTEVTRLYAHWTRRLRDSGHVLLLQGDGDDLAGVKLPKLTTRPSVGRGFLCIRGTAEAIQVARR